MAKAREVKRRQEGGGEDEARIRRGIYILTLPSRSLQLIVMKEFSLQFLIYGTETIHKTIVHVLFCSVLFCSTSSPLLTEAGRRLFPPAGCYDKTRSHRAREMAFPSYRTGPVKMFVCSIIVVNRGMKDRPTGTGQEDSGYRKRFSTAARAFCYELVVRKEFGDIPVGRSSRHN